MGREALEASSLLVRWMARRTLRLVAPALLRRIDQARLRARYASPPRQGPKRVSLEVTTACNYRCLMCLDHSPLLSEDTPARLMPWDQAERLLRELAAMGAEEVWLVGRGEPLTHPQVSRIIALATTLGLQSMITTNAALLSDSLADELCDAGLTTLSVSINAACPETYAQVHRARPEEYTRILNLVARLSQRPKHPRLFASIVLIKPNLCELLGFVDEVIRAGVAEIDVLGLRSAELFPALALDDADWARARLGIAEARERAQRAGVLLTAHCIPPDPAAARAPSQPAGADRSHWTLGCFIGYRFVRIDVDGSTHACCSCTNRLGSVDGASFAEVWHSPSYERFRQMCRTMPATRLAPYGCNCRDCGNVMDNEEVHRELQFVPVAAGDPGFASRLDLAQVVWDHFGDLLPRGGEEVGFADLTPAQAGRAWAAVTGLQAAGVMVGHRMPGGPHFMPRQVAGRADAAQVLQRVASLLGVDAAEAERLVASAAPALRDPDPLLRSELEHWVRAVRMGLGQAAPAG